MIYLIIYGACFLEFVIANSIVDKEKLERNMDSDANTLEVFKMFCLIFPILVSTFTTLVLGVMLLPYGLILIAVVAFLAFKPFSEKELRVELLMYVFIYLDIKTWLNIIKNKKSSNVDIVESVEVDSDIEIDVVNEQ